MTKISKDLIDSLSKLAKINLSKEQEEKYAGEFSSVMGYMDEIKNINVDHIPETSRIANDENVLREDVVKQSLDQKEALKNSKNTSNGYFLVPAIFKDD
ncbi:Aspartyl/glutamyl-tRNA(Asn/Gln) amidotransferase subunit C [Candidatus Roizmanbacteria bacterium]|nr:Aspartyl/glutamyl-tRNA(Asn/Gln) amidotransferase subunit C [Candidatus Roizmanbacteria bacterium]